MKSSSSRRLPVSPSPSLPTHGGSRAGAGRPAKTHATKNVTVELHEDLAQAWTDHCKTHKTSKPKTLAKWLKWRKPK